MNISGVLVRTHPGNIEPTRHALERLDGVEVHAANADGRLVVTIERDSDSATADTLTDLQNIPGVLFTSMIYHQFEELGPEETVQ